MPTSPTEPDRGAAASAPAQSPPAVPAPAGHDGGGRGQAGTPRAPNPSVRRERRHRLVGWRSGDILRATVLVIGVYYGLRLLWQAQVLVLAAFLGILFGLAVDAGVDRLEQLGIKRRGLSAALIVLVFIGLLVGFGAWTAPTLRRQSRELQVKLPQAVDKIQQWVENHRSGVLGLLLTQSGEANPAQATAQREDTLPPGGREAAPAAGQRRDSTATGAGAQTADTAAAARGRTAGGSTLRDRIFGQVSGARRYFFGFLSSTVQVFAGILLVIFLAIYIAAEPKRYHDGLMHLFPHGSRQRAGEVLTAVALVLRKWLIAQLIAMVVIGTVTTIALLLLGVEAAFPLGILAGLLEFIPTVGPIMSALPAVAMGFVDSPQKALYVGFLYIAIQFLENHILIPNLMREVELPPAITILGQALLALLFGFLGLLVAVPLVAALQVVVKMLYVQDVVGDPVAVMNEDDDDDD